MKVVGLHRRTVPGTRRRDQPSMVGLRAMAGIVVMTAMVVVVVPVLAGKPAGVAAAAANPVGSFTSKTGTALAALAVSPQTVGDVLVVFAEVSTTGHTVSSVSGGGVATWTKGVQFTGTGGVDTELWFGKVTTTGSSMVTFTWSASIAGHGAEYGAQEFGAGLGSNTVWSLDKSGSSNGASSTKVLYPSLTPTSTGELYFGYAEVANTATTAATTGFTSTVTANGNSVTYDPNVSSAVTPASAQSPAGVSTSVGVLLNASAGTPPPMPTVIGVSPSTGGSNGGTSVVITGTSFTGATVVKFGSTSASFTVNGAGQITATSPAESLGTVDVTVMTPGGPSPVNAPADQFTFTVPTTPVVTAVGSFTSKTGTALAALAVSPQTVGDVLVVFAEVSTTGHTVSSVSGGGVATWTKGVQFTGTGGVDTELWFGKVTTTGSSMVTFTWSASIAGHGAEYGAQEFGAGLGASTVWSLDKSGSSNGASSTKVPYPSLTPTGTGELYFGYAEVANTATTAASTGFTSAVTANGNSVTYNPNVSSAVTPASAQSPAGVSTSVGVLLNASGGTPPPMPTVTGVSPSTGGSNGGISVVITGTGFTGATVVRFGSTSASFTVNGATQITATSPAESLGTVDVTAMTPGGTSPVNAPADQFTFTVPTTPVVTAVGTLAASHGTALKTLAASPKNLGDVEVVGVMGQALTLTSLSGGGVTTWTKAGQFKGSIGNDVEIWFGKVTTTGASTITFTWSGTPTGGLDYVAQEFSAGLGSSTVWALDKTGSLNGASSATVTYPTLAPSSAGELYFGFAVVDNTAGAGSTPGFTYAQSSDLNGVAYDTNVSASVSPTGTQSPAGTSVTIGALLTASAGTPPPIPAVTGLAPTSGSTGGGTSVVITGTGFTGATVVKFGSTSASFTVNGATQITASSPAESLGTVDVTVMTPGGTSPVTAPADQFTFNPPPIPAVTGLAPTSGSTGGGTSVVITGTGFTGATVVKFGTTAATAFTVNSGTQITATAPGESAATVDVTVTTPGGPSPVNAPADQFTFTAPPLPTVTGVSPSTGGSNGGTSVTITGTGFTGATAVTFGTTPAIAFTVNSDLSVTATSPAESLGTVDVTVTTPGGTSLVNSPADQFTFTVSTIVIKAVGTLTSNTGSALSTLAVTPQTLGDVLVVFAEVSTTGHTVSSVSGGGVATWTKGVQFIGTGGVDTELWFGKVTTTGAATVSFTWSASIAGHTAEYGAQEFSAGRGPSTVWAMDKSGSTNGASSTTVPFPSLTPSGGTELYFGYAEVANTATNGTSAGFTSVVTNNDNAVTYDTGVTGAVAPSTTQSPAGVSTSVGMLLSASGGAPPPVPTVTGVSPSTGTASGGTTVTITGTGFTGATLVSFGSVPDASFTVTSATSIIATSPPASLGTVGVSVTTGGVSSVVNAPADHFTVTPSDVTAGVIPLGVYPPDGGGDPPGITSYAQSTGTNPTLAVDYGDRGDGWTGMDSASDMAGWTGSGYRLVLAVPIIPDNIGATLATGATGAYNTYFTTLAQNLVAMGLSNTILRLGWEFNGNWYSWSVANATDAANFAAYWRQIVTTMRAVPGQQFQFFWNPNGPSPTSYTPDQAYPGDAYVDYVGVDQYDNSWSTPFTPANGWANDVSQQWGLNWLASFSATHHKAIAIAEWSDEFRSDGHGFGDDPSFIDNMAAWFVANDVAFTDNFSYDSSSTYRNNMLDGTFPKSLVEFEKVFG